MSEKIIAGTIMLTMLDGTKKFLVNKCQNEQHLVSAIAQPERTGLASILERLKEEVNLDVTHLELLELTNGVIKGQSVPLFVFEAVEKNVPLDLPHEYVWEDFKHFQQIVQKFNIEGMPSF
ncbi:MULTISPECIES: hypothetical protein [Enterococcus]|uniref:Nudix hydrolase domain-containing protein n=1 Tax=Enterococcus sulfureus ATCC 49903 TaxID=1140003 RepID=S0KLA7_9ENTE|nr:hypothetical protein [Enterococcus sulfureus]EOT45487.1 hypothetical protein OMY_02066 [Enterococcus sulfureus ATCC 49903]EOT83378.1 hypothetical protein I573_01928 [Enterococcus sulfureus ATCC 49903]